MNATTSSPGVHRLEIDVERARRELVSAHLWAHGATGVQERSDGLTAWFVEPPETLLSEASELPELARSNQRWTDEPDRDWQAEWKATIAPVHAGRITIVPSWLADDHVPRTDELTLVIDPGRAFGTGHHATTTLCLELLDEHRPPSAPPDDTGPGALTGLTVADVGCGTGVLAIAAARRGAAAVRAVDIDPDAVEVTRANAATNGVDLDLDVGSVERVDPPVELLLANLVTDVVVRLAPALVAACTDTLIVSGVAEERRDRALQALRAAGAAPTEVRTRDGWIAIRAEVDR